MNVLHINQSDFNGGAAIAAHRLHDGLLKNKVNSRMLVGVQILESDKIATTPRRFWIEHQLSRIAQPLGLNYLNIINSFEIPNHTYYQEADILNFHNLHFGFYVGYFNYLALPRLTRDKPAIFTLHDMWSFTGHCAFSYDCERWKTGCGSCPYPNIGPSIRRDNTRLEWKLKRWSYEHAQLTIVAPSRWLATQAKHSIFKQFDVHHIPYGVDTDAYQPLDSTQCRAALGIPQKSKVILVGATNLQEERKGGDLLIQALRQLPTKMKAETILLMIGGNSEDITKHTDVQTLSLGYISNDRLKSIAYSAADLFVLPTRADNLPLVLQESMACGTPMVAFDVGGVADLVRHNNTGYLAKPNNAEDLSQGMILLLEEPNERARMSRNCRTIALNEYSLELQAQRYIELYGTVLGSPHIS